MDDNLAFMQHKVIVIDDAIVITGLRNFSLAALESRDDHILIVFDPALDTAYNQAFDRRWQLATVPEDVVCP